MGKLSEIDKQYVANTYARFPVELISGKGSVLIDTDGKEYRIKVDNNGGEIERTLVEQSSTKSAAL